VRKTAGEGLDKKEDDLLDWLARSMSYIFRNQDAVAWEIYQQLELESEYADTIKKPLPPCLACELNVNSNKEFPTPTTGFGSLAHAIGKEEISCMQLFQFCMPYIQGMNWISDGKNPAD
jgi:hypothetical protein